MPWLDFLLNLLTSHSNAHYTLSFTFSSLKSMAPNFLFSLSASNLPLSAGFHISINNTTTNPDMKILIPLFLSHPYAISQQLHILIYTNFSAIAYAIDFIVNIYYIYVYYIYITYAVDFIVNIYFIYFFSSDFNRHCKKCFATWYTHQEMYILCMLSIISEDAT